MRRKTINYQYITYINIYVHIGDEKIERYYFLSTID